MAGWVIYGGNRRNPLIPSKPKESRSFWGVPNPPFLKGMKRIPAGFLLEGFQIEGMAKGMNSLGTDDFETFLAQFLN